MDLMGRLSNPPEHLKHLVKKGADTSRHDPKRHSPGSGAVTVAANPVTSEETGRLSNPITTIRSRRLTRADDREHAASLTAFIQPMDEIRAALKARRAAATNRVGVQDRSDFIGRRSDEVDRRLTKPQTSKCYGSG